MPIERAGEGVGGGGGVWAFSIRHSAFRPSPTPRENVITDIVCKYARGMGHPPFFFAYRSAII